MEDRSEKTASAGESVKVVAEALATESDDGSGGWAQTVDGLWLPLQYLQLLQSATAGGETFGRVQQADAPNSPSPGPGASPARPTSAKVSRTEGRGPDYSPISGPGPNSPLRPTPTVRGAAWQKPARPQQVAWQSRSGLVLGGSMAASVGTAIDLGMLRRLCNSSLGRGDAASTSTRQQFLWQFQRRVLQE